MATVDPASRGGHRMPAVGRYLASVALVVVATVVGWPVHLVIEPTNLVILYLAAVVVAASLLGRGPAVLASILGVAAFDFFLVPPKLTFAVRDTQYLLTFLGLLVVGLVISTLAAKLRDQVEAGRLREEQTAALYSLSRDLAAAGERSAVVGAVVEHVGQTFGRAGAILLPEEGGLAVVGSAPGVALEADEIAVATWAYRHGQAAGEGTDTLPSARMRHLPLTTARGALGVLSLAPGRSEERFDASRRRLIESFASQAAVAIERAELAEQAGQLELLRATEHLHAALLNSISHELRTPLASITGVLSTLRRPSGGARNATPLDDSARGELVEVAWEQTGRLNRLVGNLLDMTRLEAGALRIVREPCDLQDLIGTVLADLAEPLQGREVSVALPADLPLISADFVLLAQALTNVLDNAQKYSPAGTPIEIAARLLPEAVELTLADRGPGIPPGERERVFEKFHRGPGAGGTAGTGLGLSISRGILAAHGGSIEAVPREGGGTTMRLRVPLSERAGEGARDG